MDYTTIINNQTISLADIPEVGYKEFMELNTGFLIDSPERALCELFWLSGW